MQRQNRKVKKGGMKPAATTQMPVPAYTIADVKGILAQVGVLTKNSADTYARHLSLFSRDMGQPDIAVLLNNYNDVDRYIQTKTAARSGQPLTAQTKKSYYITLRALAEHLPFVNADAKAFYIKRQDDLNKEVLQKPSGKNQPLRRECR